MLAGIPGIGVEACGGDTVPLEGEEVNGAVHGPPGQLLRAQLSIMEAILEEAFLDCLMESLLLIAMCSVPGGASEAEALGLRGGRSRHLRCPCNPAMEHSTS